MAGGRYIWLDDTPSTSEAVAGSAEVLQKTSHPSERTFKAGKTFKTPAEVVKPEQNSFWQKLCVTHEPTNNTQRHQRTL